MDALIVVPCLISKNVNEKIVPALAKVIERNIVLNNSALFRRAAYIRFAPRYGMKIYSKKDDKNLKENITYINTMKIDDEYLKHLNESKLNSVLNERWDENFSNSVDDYENNIQRLVAGTISGLKNANSENQKRLRDLGLELADAKKSNDRNKQNQIAAELNAYKEENKNTLARDKISSDALNKLLSYSLDKKKFEKDLRSERKDNQKHASDLLGQAYKNRESLAKSKELEAQTKARSDRARYTKSARSGESEYQTRNVFSAKDQVETPTGIQFFNQISLEPTILEIPISVNLSKDPADGQQTFIVRLGVKAVPYTVNDVTSIRYLLREARTMNAIERFFKNYLRRIDLFKIWDRSSRNKRAIRAGQKIDPSQAKNMLIYSPNLDELNDPKKVSKLFDLSSSSPWSTMLILSSFDLEDDETRDIIKNYRKMTKSFIGDLVITNETKETAHFCTVRYGACQELSFDYLKKILNLDNIIDSSLTSRMAKPFSKARSTKISSLVKENTSDNNSKQILNETVGKVLIKKTNHNPSVINRLNKINKILNGE
jgi:hypothetical protein